MMKKLLLILFFMLSISMIGQTNIKYYIKLDKAISKQKNKKIEKILNKLASIETENFITSLKSAEYFSQINKLDTAAMCIERAIDQYKYLPIDHTLNNFYITKDSLYKFSIIIYDKIVSIKPLGAHYCNRGVLKKDIGLYKESIIDFTKAIEIDSLDFMSYYNRGMAYRQLNLLDSSISDYTKCNQLNPNYASGYLNKGYALIHKNSYLEAIVEFEIALSKPIGIKEVGYTLNNIGFAYYKLADYNLATRYIMKSLETYPPNSFAYKNLALVNIALDNNQEACTNIQKSIELGFTNQFGNEILELQGKHCE